MWSDLGLAMRQAKRRPAYALTCALVLAFGLGACTTIFSALYSAVLKPLPYPDPDQLVTVRTRFRDGPSVGVSAADYLGLSAHREAFSDAGVYYFLDLSLSGEGAPRKVNAVAISSSLFRTLGARPIAGRTFSEIEERYNGPHAVILSESYWDSDFARDPQILRRALRLNGEMYPIVGVMPKSFAFPNNVTEMWTPLSFRDPNDSGALYLRMHARLASGVGFEQASARVAELSRENPQLHNAPGWAYFLTPVLRADDPSLRRWFWILFAAVGCLLLIVCSNVAGLALVRSAERRADVAIRLALGASRWRIARQTLVESFSFAACGGVVGFALSRFGVAALARFGPAQPPRMEMPVFLFGAAITLFAAIACGIFPAFESGALRLTASRGRWQRGFIVIQVGVATMLLVCGGLLIHSLVLLLGTPLGFDPRNVLTMTVSLPRSRYSSPESKKQFFDSLIDQTSAIPGVESASGCTLLPFGYGENLSTVEIVGRPVPATKQFVDTNVASGKYFEAMRIPLVRGRLFNVDERARVVLIDEAFARRFFPNEDPLGKPIKSSGGVYVVAGVVGAVKASAIDLEAPATLYFSSAQFPVTDMTLAIRSSLTDQEIVRDVQRIVASLDRDQPVYDVAPLQSRIDHSLRTRRFVVFLVLAFAVAGTALAALGLYGLLSYSIVLRRREIGIRIAVGAGPRRIAILIGRDGMMLVVCGIALGSAASAAAYRFIAAQIYGVHAGDPVTWISVLATIFLTGLVATAVPALRAARTDPIDGLK